MQKTQNGLRKKIVFAGRTNAGKSSLINAIVGDHVSIVSDVKGTTTDTVKRAYEILGFGPVLLCDTAGFGDDTALGRAREQAATEAVKNADLVVLVVGDREMNAADKALIASLVSMKIPYLIVYNKNDIFKRDIDDILIDTVTKTGVDLLVRKMAEILSEQPEKKLLDGIVKAGDKVLLVMPQDSSAPKGRLILPQVQMIRELLDIHALVSCVQTEEVVTSCQAGEYDLIITDSKVIKEVLSVVPSAQRVSTFSVLFARSKGNFEAFLTGLSALDTLQDNDTILIAEACVHTTHEDDIAREMLPKLLQKRTGKRLNFIFASGKKIPDDLSDIALILQCGGCMLTPKEMQVRLDTARMAGVPMTNYGLAITKCQVGDIFRLTF